SRGRAVRTEFQDSATGGAVQHPSRGGVSGPTPDAKRRISGALAPHQINGLGDGATLARGSPGRRKPKENSANFESPSQSFDLKKTLYLHIYKGFANALRWFEATYSINELKNSTALSSFH